MSIQILSTTNNTEFAEKDDHHADVKWLIGLLLLLVGNAEMVDMSNPENTWKASKAFWQEKAKSGLGKIRLC